MQIINNISQTLSIQIFLISVIFSQVPQPAYSLNFDGDDDVVEIPGLLGKQENITLSAWAKVESNQRGEIISIGDHVAMRLNDGGKHTGFFHKATGGGWFGTSTTTTLGDGWHFFTYTNYDSLGSGSETLIEFTNTPARTGWTNAWQSFTTTNEASLDTITLQLSNTSASNDYNLAISIYQTDNALTS
ncbi:MAG: hypothetical protein CMG70_04655, partial [Candidatus Marinimicrobia bacterium]|nr:hypothetical protein [Candidatus Neomarinimicrobiota bacterium]